MIKAIFFDIDGTLLSFRTHQVSEGTIEAFKVLRQKGIKTFISSGRPPLLISPMPITFDGYITMNGGYCYEGNNVLLSNPISLQSSQRWLHYAKEHNICTFSFFENEIYVNYISKEAEKLRNDLGFQMPPILPIEELEGRRVFQFIVMQPSIDDAKVLAELPDCRMPRWHPAFSDLVPMHSSKALGIEAIIKHYGIAREETMAFGDGGNDIEMLQYVQLGVAMGNASHEVQQVADYVTTSVDEEGIWNALKHFNII